MNIDSSFKVIKTLDNMPRVLFWTVDEFSVLIVPCIIGIAIGSFFLGIAGIPMKYFYSKYKKQFPKGSLMHRAYWSFPKIVFKNAGVLRKTPGSHQRELLL